MASEPIIVRAIHNFKGNNNDELNFKKGDLITLTQKDEGWWEGTLNGKTGWFPSNYVKECKDAPKPIIHQQSQYKAVVLKDLIDSEKAHVTELEGLMTMFLHPLEKSTILTEDEYKQLTGNIGSVLETHQQLLQLLEIESTKNGLDQRVGRLFLNWAPKIKNVHQTYCSLHPKAVCIIDKYKDELNKYMESRGASSPGVLVLTTMLSKPFRRLDKYSGMLQELERHVEESHPDRGDTQRSVAIYKDLATTCTATRRQKELELQVLTGPIRDLEGPPLSTLGDIVYMGSVAFGPQHHDRYFVLFPSTLVILSVSHRLSAFIYEGRLVLSSVNVTRLDDTDKYKNAFEISSPMIDRKLVICQSRDEANHWVELIRRGGMGGKERTISQIKTPPQPPPHMSPLVSTPGRGSKISQITLTPQILRSGTSSVVSNTPRINNNWSAACLRPRPPLRPCLAHGMSPNGPYNRKQKDYKDDGLILEVIEAYCSVVKPRNTINSANMNQLLTIGPKCDLSKSLQDTIHTLQMMQLQFGVLENNVKALTVQISEEREARCALQTVVKNFLINNSKDLQNIEWSTMESNI